MFIDDFKGIKESLVPSRLLMTIPPGESMKPNLRLWGIIICVIAVAIWISSIILDFFRDYLKDNSGTFTVPFYLALIGLLVFLLGDMLFLKGKKRNKQNSS